MRCSLSCLYRMRYMAKLHPKFTAFTACVPLPQVSDEVAERLRALGDMEGAGLALVERGRVELKNRGELLD